MPQDGWPIIFLRVILLTKKHAWTHLDGSQLYRQGHFTAQGYLTAFIMPAFSTKSSPFNDCTLELNPSLDIRHQRKGLSLSSPCHSCLPQRKASPHTCAASTNKVLMLKLHVQPSAVIEINSPCSFSSWFLSTNQGSLFLYHFTNITPFPGIILAA